MVVSLSRNFIMVALVILEEMRPRNQFMDGGVYHRSFMTCALTCSTACICLLAELCGDMFSLVLGDQLPAGATYLL